MVVVVICGAATGACTHLAAECALVADERAVKGPVLLHGMRFVEVRSMRRGKIVYTESSSSTTG